MRVRVWVLLAAWTVMPAHAFAEASEGEVVAESAEGSAAGEGCGEGSGAPEAAAQPIDLDAPIPQMTVEELAEALDSAVAVPMDANTPNTRSTSGVIPGAVLLSGAEFAPSEVEGVPSSANLVFYCYNESCLASDRAAQVARTQGFANVYVLPAGIRGWVGAGQPTDRSAVATP